MQVFNSRQRTMYKGINASGAILLLAVQEAEILILVSTDF